MKLKNLVRSIGSVALISWSAVIVFGQEGTRSITSDDFAKNRPAAVKVTVSNGRPLTGTRKSVVYRSKKREKVAIRWKRSGKGIKKPKPAGKMVASDIGITVWKMRRPLATDNGVQLVVATDGGDEMWSSVRVDPLSNFRAGDRIRIGIESPTAGFLYVINSEVSSDGSFGAPSLIFPTVDAKFNSVTPGMLVDIPDQKENYPYFMLRPSRGEYAGELVAIIITPVKLDFELDDKGKILNIDSIIDLDSDIDLEIFASIDTNGELFSRVEADAACGSKTRELVRDKRQQTPCGTATRSLSKAEAPPQTIYRINTYPGRPAIAFIRLNATY